MNLLAHSLRSKGGAAFVRRTGIIVSRFGPTPAKVMGSMASYIATLTEYGCTATFPITAVLVLRHKAAVQRLRDTGVELAVHGYVHTDHTTLSAEEQAEQIGRAVRVFRDAGISFAGFRSPYLQYDDNTIAAVQKLGFQYVSNQVIWYDTDFAFSSSRSTAYQKALQLYALHAGEPVLERPWLRGDLVEIPVAMPDDEILVDRLGLDETTGLGDAWIKLVDRSFEKGGLLTLQLHPERGAVCRRALTLALDAARNRPRPVWTAPLREIAAWWRRRAAFEVKVEALGCNRWQVSGPADADATMMIEHFAPPRAGAPCGQDLLIDGGHGVVECPVRPVIGVSPRSESLRGFLMEEGYAVCSGIEPADCALYFDQPGPLAPADQAAFLERIHESRASLVRLGRWPRGAQSALAVTGDIDALTLGDFMRRLWEVR